MPRVSDYFQLDDLHLIRLRQKPANSLAQFQVTRDFRVQFKLSVLHGDFLVNLTVPNGMFTDLASIPQAAQSFVSKLGPHIEAAVVHDYLCITKGRFYDNAAKHWVNVSSKIAADIFHIAMLEGGTDPEQAALMAFAVKTFGPQWD